MFFLLTILVVGGMRSLPGLVIATTALIVAREAFQQFEAYQLIIFGSLVTIVMLVAPDGLAGLAGRALRWVRRSIESGTRRPTAPAGARHPVADRSGAGLMALLEVRNLKRSFGGIEAVADVSFEVEEGAIHGLIGPNGSGKTTIFNVLSGYYAPSAGEIVFDGRSIGSRPPHEIVAARDRPHVPEPEAVPYAHGPGERPGGGDARRRAMVAACPRVPRRVAPIRHRRPQPGGRIVAAGWVRPSSLTFRSRACRMGGSAGSSSRVPWRVNPGSSCLMSRLPA